MTPFSVRLDYAILAVLLTLLSAAATRPGQPTFCSRLFTRLIKTRCRPHTKERDISSFHHLNLDRLWLICLCLTNNCWLCLSNHSLAVSAALSNSQQMTSSRKKRAFSHIKYLPDCRASIDRLLERLILGTKFMYI